MFRYRSMPLRIALCARAEAVSSLQEETESIISVDLPHGLISLMESRQMRNMVLLLAALGCAPQSFAQTASTVGRTPLQTAQLSIAGGPSSGAGSMSAVVEYAPTTMFYVAFVAVIAKALTVKVTAASRH